ncbi:unnamed protein product [Enterobius vermicularis]|uniref:Pecanex-like protein n=1 Tax=Enterobius vermicularis TaxID=51028 RepID=A0A0N4V3X3_ENTVE|nr:unnamed protein product [Enterobius vermicularis]
MANENRPKISTGFLQPAKVDYKSLDENTFGDPYPIAFIEQLESVDDRLRRNSAVNDDNDSDNSDDQMFTLRFFRTNSENIPSRFDWLDIIPVFCILVVTFEAVFAFLSKSTSCVMDVLRWLSDFCGHYKLVDRNSRVQERLALKSRKFLGTADFICLRFEQFLHMFGNHGIAAVVLTVTALINIQQKSRAIDMVAAYIIAVLLICNTFAAFKKGYSRFRRIRSNRYQYDEL